MPLEMSCVAVLCRRRLVSLTTPARRLTRRHPAVGRVGTSTILLAMAAVTLVVLVAVVAYNNREKGRVAYNCTQVSTPMTSIKPLTDTEPRVRYPSRPAGSNPICSMNHHSGS